MRKLVGITGDLAGKQRFGENVIGQHRHVARHIGGASETFVAIGKNLGCPLHRLGEAVDVARCEHWRHGLARAPPDLAFRRQQPIAQDRAQNALAHRGHLVILGIVNEHMADQAGIIGDDRMREGPVN